VISLKTRLLQALYSRRGLPWAVHDEFVRIDPLLRHMIPHEGEPALFGFLKDWIRPGSVVLDVGAFLGVYAILSAKWSGPGGRVVTIEPTASSAAAARRHLEWNGLGPDRVRLVEAAVSDRPGEATLFEYDLPFVNSLSPAVDTREPPRRRTVRVVTIDDVCRDLKIAPDIVRMDVQGAEIHALRGARETIRTANPMLVVETHPQCWPAFDVTESMARDTIRDLGLIASPLVDGEPLFARDGHVVLRRSLEAGARGWKPEVRAQRPEPGVSDR
jgi:FkbM family methyltransferase